MNENTVVLDASPVIFLGKIERLSLFAKLALGRYIMSEAVRDEILTPDLPATLQPVVQAFVSNLLIFPAPNPPAYASVLSQGDRSVLALAEAQQATLIIADDLPLRKFAKTQGRAVLGTLGVLLLAVKRGQQTAAEAMTQVQTLVTRHNFRLAVDVYVEFQRQLQDLQKQETR